MPSDAVLITSQFVVLNLPKTGSTFVREVIKAIYARRRWQWRRDRFLKELILPNERGLNSTRDQHGGIAQIPPAHRRLPVVAAVRNPFDKLLSAYEFRWWADHPPLPRDRLLRAFPRFPDLSLDEFVGMQELDASRRLGGSNPLGLGYQTIQFVQFFFQDPERVLRSLSDEHVASGALRAEMADVHFLRQERLGEDLAGFLEGFSFSSEERDLCRSYPKVNETAGGATDRSALWTAAALDYVRYSERYLLRLLEQCGLVHQHPPAPVAMAGRP